MKTYNSVGRGEWKNHNELSDSDWSQVPAKLAELGVSFAPIYGAEPLTRLDALCNFIKGCSEVSLPNTVITNGMLLNAKSIKLLKDAGLRSITLSDDIISIDKQVSLKSNRSKQLLEVCKNNFEDVELIVTVNKQNLALLPSFIFDHKDNWIHFDFQHHDRKQPGCKCKGTEPIFSDEDNIEIRSLMLKVLSLKKLGYLIHPSIESLKLLAQKPDLVTNSNWICEPGSLLTLNSDGKVYGCDDFQPKDFSYDILEYKSWDWETWVKDWSNRLLECPGCCWLTHVQSSLWYKREDEQWKKEMVHYV